jgi:hypothetical protein
MAAKPNPDIDERVHIRLDPEVALRALLKVEPGGDAPTERVRSPTCT